MATKSYNVTEALIRSGLTSDLRRASFILAFCGFEMYVIKSRDIRYTPQTWTPKEPDSVIAYYLTPEGPMVKFLKGGR